MSSLKPSEIFYSQDSINSIFTGRHMHSGKQIGDTLDELADGRTTVEQINTISVKHINGKWFTGDNRRLWVFKHFELLGGCTYIPVNRTSYIDLRKFTTCNGGESVRIRGSPGGIWYLKLIRNPAQYQNCLRGLFSDPYSKTSSASKIDFSISKQQSYHQTDNNEEFAFGFQSTVSTSHSTNISPGTSLRNYSERAEGLVPYTTQISSERLTYSYENKTGSSVNLNPTLSLTNHVEYQETTKDADLHRHLYTDGSPLPGTQTVSFEGRSQKAGTKLKAASRQAFTQLINVKQQKVNPKIPVMIMLDPSEIRFTKDAIEYPLSDKRWPTVQRRLLDLRKAEKHKPFEAYMAYDIYWVKEENDVLWSLNNHPDWRKIKLKLNVLVIEDNDAFLEFMRKEKPWLQISDILQTGQNIELIK